MRSHFGHLRAALRALSKPDVWLLTPRVGADRHCFTSLERVSAVVRGQLRTQPPSKRGLARSGLSALSFLIAWFYHVGDMPSLSSLSAYFDRIEYRGPHSTTLATLDGIVSHHVSRIPFENLDVLLGRGISIDLGRIEQKLVAERRGGYCFEQNTLLLAVLEALGFEVTPLSARVRVQRTREFTPARTHLCLRVMIDGEAFLADVGVGGFSLASALRLVPDIVQTTPHEPRRLVREGLWDGLSLRAPDARLFHQVQLADAWYDLYELTLEPMPVIDREVSNWYTSTHPDSHFRNRLMAARAMEGGRITLLNRELTVRYNHRPPESRTLSSNAELLAALDEHFGLQLPAGTRFDVSELASLT